MEDFDLFFKLTFFLPILLIVVLILLYRKRENFKQNKVVKILIWNFLLLLFLLSFVFLIGETYYRFFVDTTDSFAVNKVSRRWNKRHNQLNNRLLRDNIDYHFGVAKGKRRITILGDSFTSGHGVKNVDDRFANILRKMYPNLEIHVIASNGDSSVGELIILEKLVSEGYQLDFVMLSYCLNDIDYFLKDSPKVYKRIHAFASGLGYMNRNSYFINTLSFRAFALSDDNFMNYSDFVKEGYDGKTWEEQKKVLKKIKSVVEKQNGRLMTVTFPFLQKDFEEYDFKGVHKKINEFWATENVPHLDLLETYKPMLGPQLTVNKYDAHPNELAHKLAADAIDEFLKEKRNAN